MDTAFMWHMRSHVCVCMHMHVHMYTNKSINLDKTLTPGRTAWPSFVTWRICSHKFVFCFVFISYLLKNSCMEKHHLYLVKEQCYYCILSCTWWISGQVNWHWGEASFLFLNYAKLFHASAPSPHVAFWAWNSVPLSLLHWLLLIPPGPI